ncbi:hypothetical protein MCOR02_010541 [Pyricularia oryzae]|nr:hypothetical protein MCOR02_010541 [Pyricularia oryzae]
MKRNKHNAMPINDRNIRHFVEGSAEPGLGDAKQPCQIRSFDMLNRTMRLSTSTKSTRIGGVRIHALQQVIELDSGNNSIISLMSVPDNDVVQPSALRSIAAQMAIVVPCMDEDIATIEGVLSGIPHESLVILVSNSSHIEAYDREMDALHRFSRISHRSAIAVHQQDPGLAAAFLTAGMPELVDPTTQRIRNGKGEAMLVGAALAAATGRRYVGFIDADNFVPGSVREYCEAFAAGLHLAQAGRQTGKAMVRLSWGSKPKVRDGKLEFAKEGRSSRITNRWLNRLLSEIGAKDSDIIATGNAGEHAMSIELALKMCFAGGFAVEPFQYLDLLEQFGSSHEGCSSKNAAGRHWNDLVEVLQIETRNPHLHQDKGDDHIKDMWAQALGVIHRSAVTPTQLRQLIEFFVAENDARMPGPGETRVYPPIESLDLLQLWESLEEASALKVCGDPMGIDFAGTELTLGVVTLLEGVKECISGITRDLLTNTGGGCSMAAGAHHKAPAWEILGPADGGERPV